MQSKKGTLRPPVGYQSIKAQDADNLLDQQGQQHSIQALQHAQQQKKDSQQSKQPTTVSNAARRLSMRISLGGGQNSGEEKKNASQTINLQHIMQLREAFQEADTDQGGSLELPQFINAFGDVLGKGMTPKQIQQLFWKIDANSDGTVDWNEFMNYMLLENETLSSMKAEHFEYVKSNKPDPPPGRNDSHTDMIQQILPLDMKQSQGKSIYKYLSAGRDGKVKMWSGNNQGMVQTSQINVGKSWVTAITTMKLSEKLVIASANRSVSFYDLNQSNISTPVSKISDMDGVPLCLDYYYKTGENRKEVLFIGDDLGIIHLYTFTQGWHICDWTIRSENAMNCEEHQQVIEKRQQKFIQKSLQETTNKKQVFDKDYLNRKIDRHYKKNVDVLKCVIHCSWITKIKYIDDVASIVSCGLDGFIHFHELEKFKHRRTFKLHQKGVNSFVWCASNRFMASCGEERHIILWNAYTTKAIAYLYGHNTSVEQLCIHQERNHLISLGTDKVVKIWDIRTYRCVQTLVDKFSYRPQDRLICMIYDPKIHSILLGSRKINIWMFKTQQTIPTSHEFGISIALFNTKFDSVVACDDGSNVLVWDAQKGKLMSKFADAHDKKKIATACFDQSQRRLVTGATDGSIKVWNFSNGQCLSVMYSVQNSQVTSAIYISENQKNKLPYIATAGWNKKIQIWPDDKQQAASASKTLPLQNHNGHEDDIMSLAYSSQQNLLFSGAHDGSLIAWSFQTGFPKFFMHRKDQKMIHRQAAKNAKSIDNLIVLEKKQVLLSSSADQLLRFWQLSTCNLILTISAQHGVDNHASQQAITAICTTQNNNYLITGDTSGNLKLHDISQIDFSSKQKLQTNRTKMPSKWFIQAHKRTINSIQVIEKMYPGWKFILTASDDRNIMLHTWQGIAIGYFGQPKGWSTVDIDSILAGKSRVEPRLIIPKNRKFKKLRFAPDDQDKLDEINSQNEDQEDDLNQQNQEVFHAQQYQGQAQKKKIDSKFLKKFKQESDKKSWHQSGFHQIDIDSHRPIDLHKKLTGKQQKWFIDELKVQTSFFKFNK